MLVQVLLALGFQISWAINIAPIIDSLPNCVIVNLEFSAVIDRSAIQVPIVLDTALSTWRQWGQRSYKSRNMNCTTLLTIAQPSPEYMTENPSNIFLEQLRSTAYSLKFDSAILLFVTLEFNLAIGIQDLLQNQTGYWENLPSPRSLLILRISDLEQKQILETYCSGPTLPEALRSKIFRNKYSNPGETSHIKKGGPGTLPVHPVHSLCQDFGISGVLRADESFRFRLMEVQGIKTNEFYFEMWDEIEIRVESISSIMHFQGVGSKYAKHHHSKLSTVWDMRHNVNFLCHSYLKILLQGLNNTRIAFVTAQEDFDYHWNLLERVFNDVSSQPIRLGSNRKGNDSFLQKPSQFFFPEGPSELQEVVLFRLRVLITSGIFGLWEKWDKIKFSNPPRNVWPRNVEVVIPLGFGTSNIHLIFYLLLFGLMLALVIASMEMVIRRGDSLPNCVVVTLQFGVIADHSISQVPMVMQSARTIRHNWGMYAYKSRNLKCTSLLAVIPYPFEDVMKTTRGPLKIIQTDFDKLLRRTSFDPVILIFVTLVSFMTSDIKRLVTLPYFDTIPPAMYILIVKVRDDEGILDISGWIECHCCIPDLLQNEVKFTCPQMQSCYASMIRYFKVAGVGQKVLWYPDLEFLREKSFEFPKPGYAESSPFGRREPIRLLKSVSNFLVGHLNSSSTSGKLYANCPVITYDEQLITPRLVLPVGSRTSFKFITPDGVYSIQDSFELYIQPFSPSIWLVLILTAVLVSLIINRLSATNSPFLGRFASIFFEISTVFLEKQAVLKKEALRRIPYIILGAYLLMAVIITNSYKGTLKSDFTIRFPYETKWKYFVEIQHFRFYVLFEESDCRHFGVSGMFKANQSFMDKLMETRTVQSYYFELDLWYEYSKLLRQYGLSSDDKDAASLYFQGKMASLFEIRRNLYFVCTLNLKKFIDSLITTEVAFVMTQDDMGYYQDFLERTFDGILAKGLKLGNNMKVNDPLFQNPLQLMVSTSAGDVREGTGFRIRVLITSGVFGLWDKWDKIRFTRLPGMNYRKTSKADKANPLGLGSSNIHLIFYLLLAGMAVSLVVILIERVLFGAGTGYRKNTDLNSDSNTF
ncbi:unnamed protein product [Allacma fusca]|uniref:Uncharacterized protein n=1 Tax=Allacma fusca TaxID=39272 RepID=A0A8J2IZB2_9HEXA|nr:unnamed protein product [Allacma fusca]